MDKRHWEHQKITRQQGTYILIKRFSHRCQGSQGTSGNLLNEEVSLPHFNNWPTASLMEWAAK